MADIDGNFFRFPLPEAINSTLESAASVIDYQIPGTNIIITEDSNDVEFAGNHNTSMHEFFYFYLIKVRLLVFTKPPHTK